MRTSISFFPNKAKQSAKTNRIPLYLRVIHNGQKAEARLNEEISADDYLKWNAIVMRLDMKDSSLNSKLNTISKSYEDFKIMNGSKLNLFDAKKIRDLLTGSGAKNDYRIYDYAHSYYQKAVLANSGLSDGTRMNYLKALKHLSTFVVITKRETQPVTSLDPRFVNEFWDYLRSDNSKLKKKGMTEVSASGIIKKFRTIFDRAVSEDLIPRNPFRILKLKMKSAFRQKLTISEVISWHKCDLSNFPSLVLYRDIFLFSTYTGLAYSDLIGLEKSHFIELSDEELLLRKSRHKTGVQIELILSSYAKEILKKYESLARSEIRNTIFPHRSLNTLNYYNKLIADKIGIRAKVTTHISRHTNRQLLAEAGIEDDSVIKRMMGQSRANSIDGVYYNVTESRLLDAKRKFEIYLATGLNKLT